ncbi:MAG: hypothetical protein WC647_19305 [Desulfomonilaceae bacterium]|jgi:hypothetical protein
MFRLPLSLIMIFSFFLVTSGFPEALAGDVPQSCQTFPSSCEPKLVPLTYKEEGPVRSIVINAVGLLKATIQLPFRAIEAVLPVNRSMPCAPQCPVVGPLPRKAANGCGGFQLPPQLVQEHRLPPVEPNNLLQGLVNIPGAIARDDRWFGDLFRDNPNGPYSYGRSPRP